MDVLKYTLPEEIRINKIKPAIQNLINTIISDCFVLAQEKIWFDFWDHILVESSDYTNNLVCLWSASW